MVFFGRGDRDQSAIAQYDVRLLERHPLESNTMPSEQKPADEQPQVDELDIAGEETLEQKAAAAQETTKQDAQNAVDISDLETLASPAQDGFVPSDAQRESSTIMIGRYQVRRELGAGAFGVVYQAYDEQLRRDVAIKVPKSSTRHKIDPESYLNEARAVAALDEPGIVPVYDVGRSQDGNWFVVSKMIEGSDLDARIKSKPMDCVEAAQLIASVAESLHGAHKRGFAHRDIKPANILLSLDGRAYVADFGLAIHESEQNFRAGEVSGTPLYMSPEQVAGKSHHLDGRTDIWSLGVILYQLLSGRRPFNAKGSELFEEIRTRDPKPPRMINDEIPQELELIVLKCLAKQPADRYTTAKDMASDLQSWLQSQSPAAATAVATSPSLPTNQTWKIATAALLLAIVAVIYTVFNRADDPQPNPLTNQDTQAAKTPEDSNSVTDTSPAASAPILRVTHFRFNEERNEQVRFGTVRDESEPIQFEDELRVDVKLTEAAYCYVIALNPDGVIQPCYPEDGAVPVKTTEIAFPNDVTSYFALTDGRGQQAFVLVASAKPLPKWSEWIVKHPSISWTSNTQGGIWEYDGTELRQVFDKTRAVIKKRSSNNLHEFCNFLSSQSEFEIVRAVAFSVE
jgi:serine/threonine protein kinase